MYSLAHVCVDACVDACIWSPAVSFECLPEFSTLLVFLETRFLFYLVLTSSVRLAAQNSRDSPGSASPNVPPHLAFLLGSWGLNPGPYTCVARSDYNFSLQEDYHKLLTKYAEAENTIDQLRLGAKVMTGWSWLSCVGGAKSRGVGMGRGGGRSRGSLRDGLPQSLRERSHWLLYPETVYWGILVLESPPPGLTLTLA